MLLVAAAVAGAVLLGLAAITLAGGSQPLGIDHWVHDRAADLANDGVITVGRGITHMGDSLVAWITAGVVTVALLAFRKWPHAIAVGGGMLLAIGIVRVVPGRTLPFHSCTVVPLREMVMRDWPAADGDDAVVGQVGRAVMHPVVDAQRLGSPGEDDGRQQQEHCRGDRGGDQQQADRAWGRGVLHRPSVQRASGDRPRGALP